MHANTGILALLSTRNGRLDPRTRCREMITNIPTRLDDIDWELVELRAGHNEGSTAQSLQYSVRDAHRVFRDSRDVEHVLPAARGVLALLRWQLRTRRRRRECHDALALQRG